MALPADVPPMSLHASQVGGGQADGKRNASSARKERPRNSIVPVSLIHLYYQMPDRYAKPRHQPLTSGGLRPCASMSQARVIIRMRHRRHKKTGQKKKTRNQNRLRSYLFFMIILQRLSRFCPPRGGQKMGTETGVAAILTAATRFPFPYLRIHRMIQHFFNAPYR